MTTPVVPDRKVAEGYEAAWWINNDLLRCERCGGLVDTFDVEKHNNFHSLFNTLLAERHGHV